MAKLADVDSEIRIIGKFAGIGITAIIVLFFLIMGGSFMKNLLFPTPPPAPGEKFGKLVLPAFSGQNAQNLSYSIDTLTGSLPTTLTKNDRMNVVKVKSSPPSLTALANTRQLLSTQGFDQNESQVDETTYGWTNSQDNTNIQYNIANNSFKITSSFLQDPPPAILTGQASTKDDAYSTTITFLQNIGADTSNLSQSNSTATYLKIQDGNLVGAASLNDAQFIRIDLFQNDLDKYPVYFPELKQSPMYFIYKNDGANPVIVDASYANSIPDNSQISDYPIISSEQAYEQLKKGNAQIFYDNKSSNVSVTDVGVGYYISPGQQYFTPIIVFSGIGFTAYVNAIASQ